MIALTGFMDGEIAPPLVRDVLAHVYAKRGMVNAVVARKDERELGMLWHESRSVSGGIEARRLFATVAS